MYRNSLNNNESVLICWVRARWVRVGLGTTTPAARDVQVCRNIAFFAHLDLLERKRRELAARQHRHQHDRKARCLCWLLRSSVPRLWSLPHLLFIRAAKLESTVTEQLGQAPCADLQYFMNVLQRARKDDDNM